MIPESWFRAFEAGFDLWFVFAPGAWRQLRPDQRFRLFPHSRITFYLGMRLHEDAVIPGILFAAVPVGLVLRPEIPDDMGAHGIGCANVGLAAQQSARLVEIGGPDYVGRDDPVIAKNLRDTI